MKQDPALALAYRQRQLLARSAALRERFAADMAHWQPTLALLDRTLAAAGQSWRAGCAPTPKCPQAPLRCCWCCAPGVPSIWHFWVGVWAGAPGRADGSGKRCGAALGSFRADVQAAFAHRSAREAFASRREIGPAMRQPLPDALRALALLSVLAVNAGGCLVAPWGALVERRPAGSVLAGAVQGLITALLQGKGYPMLAFLFGMGLWFASRGREPHLARQRGVRRQKGLLKLGVLQGVLIYFGDILTNYALIGWHLLACLA